MIYDNPSTADFSILAKIGGLNSPGSHVVFCTIPVVCQFHLLFVILVVWDLLNGVIVYADCHIQCGSHGKKTIESVKTTSMWQEVPKFYTENKAYLRHENKLTET